MKGAGPPLCGPATRQRCVCATAPWGGSAYSALILAARITLANFSVSLTMSMPKPAGEPGSTVAPTSEKRAFSLGSARAARSAPGGKGGGSVGTVSVWGT
jgi:hypothetical protein